MTAAASFDRRVPVIILSGFLGAGKTTLLRRSLQAGELRGSLLLINEVAELGVDDRMIRLAGLPTLLVSQGCVCCTASDDLGTVLHDVLAATLDAPPIERIVVETTGLADPLGVLATIAASPRLSGQLRIQMVITVVDVLGIHFEEARSTEYLRQIELADVVLLTKIDLARSAQIERAKAAVAHANPACMLRIASAQSLGAMLDSAPELRADRIARHWLPSGVTGAATIGRRPGRITTGVSTASHSVPARSFCIQFGERVDWVKLSVWLSLMLHVHGANLLRIKGFLALQQGSAPVLINCVHHLAYFPEHLEENTDLDDTGSFLVFIVRELSPTAILRSLLMHVAPESQIRLLEPSPS